MPELPEVEAVARTLRPLLCGRRIRCAEVLHPIVTRPQTPALIRELSQGQCIEAVWRRGKYLFLELKRGLVEMHFRFDGQLLWFASARELRARTSSAAGLHVDVIFELDSGVLGFIDPRHLGRVHVWESAGDCAPLSSLGIDALSRTLTAEALHAQISSSKLPLKEFLLNQKKSPVSAISIPARRYGRLVWILAAPGIPSITKNREGSIKRLCLFSSVL
jgi:formamidopyrimidine-DNA glycosylase